jgi:subtilisin-like proprotein convertase family protein
MQFSHRPSRTRILVSRFASFPLPFLLLLASGLFALRAQGQTRLWSPAVLQENLSSAAFIPDLPDLEKGRLLQLDVPAMMSLGRSAPRELDPASGAATVIELPLPDGSFQRFRIVESTLMEPELAAKFPDIKTYLLKGVDDPMANGRLSVSPDEFGAYFTSHQFGQEVYIRKVLKQSGDIYLSFWGKDDPALQRPFTCLWEGAEDPATHQRPAETLAGPNETGDVLRVFRLAMTIPGKLSENYGWTTRAQALSALVSFLGQLNTIYERDLSVRFVLPAGQENIIFTSSATDPFTALGGGEAANENIGVINELIGQDAFDVGLIFVTGGCCAAGKPTICGEYKAWNFSAFYSLRVTAHEIGHQFDADHTWTSCGPSNNGQFGTNEYGSGTSIMSYANICGVDNILPVGIETFFGVYSQIQMTNHINARTCYKTLETGNRIPASSVPPNGFYIPISTPFELVGTADDPDGDELTFSWEQVNIRNVDFTSSTISIQTPPTPADGNVPIARIYNPVTTPRRTIPNLPDLLSNTSTVYERLPTYSRNIKYRMYVRDNHPGAGGTTHQQVSFEVDGEAGPFLVTAPNTCVSWQAGGDYTVTWDVANTTNLKVNCQEVKISLSLDGGYTYAHVLAASTPNDGAETITLPAGICSSRSRIKVEAVGNIFFDVSNEDFNIESGSTPVVRADALQLDGADDQVLVQDAGVGNFGTGDFTLEMWVQTTDNNCALIGKRPICNCENFWNFFIRDGRLHAEFSTTTSCAEYLNVSGNNNTLANGNWHHVAFVRQGNSLRYYVDGVLDRTVSSAQNFNNPAKISIGNIVCSGQNFRGSMDEIRIWNLARTATEINDKMNCTLNGDETGLLVYYPVSSQDCGACGLGANVLVDKTANAYHGVLQNGAYTSLSSLPVASCPDCANGPVTLTNQPQAQTLAIGATANYEVAAAGNNLAYQWYRSTDGGATFSVVPGAVLAQYSFEVSAAGQNGWQFKCLISNGCDVQYSDAAALVLSCPTSILSSISGPITPCADNYYTYFVTPDPNIVNWNWSTPAGWEVTAFENMIFVKPSAAAGTVSVSGTDACGGVTPTQTLDVSPQVVAITTQPLAQTVTEGDAVAFSVAVSNDGGSSTYLWQESTDGGATFNNINGATAATYTIPAADVSADDRLFRCIVANACLRDTSEAVALQVTCAGAAPGAPSAILGGTLVCENAVLTYTVASVAGADVYEWTLPAGWSGTSSANSISVTTNGAGGVLKVRALNNCGASEERTLAIAINPDPCRRSLHFDGQDDYVAVGQNNQGLNGDLSVSCWIKPDVLNGEQQFIFNGREFILGLSGNRIRYKHSDDCCGYDNVVNMEFSGNLEPGKWYHVAITRSVANRTVNCYLNGNLLQSQTYGGNVAQPGNSTVDMIFGAGKNGVWSHYNGALDEVKIWNLVRSEAELKQDMVCYPGGNEPGLMAYYDFETGQPYGDNQSIAEFPNLAGAYAGAAVRNMAMAGVASNVVSGDQPSFLYQDLDGDGFGGASVDCNYTGATVTNAGDCDDSNNAVYPFATEICNGIDDDCSGVADDLPNLVSSTNVPVPIPAGQTISSTLAINSPTSSLLDLNVLNLRITHIWVGDLTIRLRSPQGTEVMLVQSICGDQDDMLINFDDESPAEYGAIPCPPVNNGTYKPLSPLSAFDGENPNGVWTLIVADEYEDAGVLEGWSLGFPTVPETFYADADGDGFGNSSTGVQACVAPGGYVNNALDCDDNNAQVHPGATEVCNDVDDNCDGQADEGLGTLWYADADGDGFGHAASSVLACVAPGGYVSNAGDCDDNNAQVYPGATEVCNDVDDNCDGQADEGLGTLWYADADGDGFGNVALNVLACAQPAAYVQNADDCDDSNSAIYPDAVEVLNGLDDDCNGMVDDSLMVGVIEQGSGNMPFFVLQPNPADDRLQVVLAPSEKAGGQIAVYNPVGQCVLVQDVAPESGGSLILPVQHLPQGQYYLMYQRQDGLRSGARFVVVRGEK